MSSTFAEDLQNAIKEYDSSKVVPLLEPKVHDGTATESERLLCGILLMMPPFADYHAAPLIFNSLHNGTRRFEAAVWSAYHYTVILPDGDTKFKNTLLSFPYSSIAAYFLSEFFGLIKNPHKELIEIRRSVSLRMFPFNTIRLIRIDEELSIDDKRNLFKIASDLILDKDICNSGNPSTIEGMIQSHWDNLITGTRITKELWNCYKREFKKYTD